MEEIIKSVKVNYELYGNGDKTIVLLHGWGQNIEMMKPIGDNFSKNYKVLIPDLPGFGKSDEPSDIWTMYDYADFIHELIEKLDIKFDGTVLPCPAFKEITVEECRRFNIKLPNIYTNLEDVKISGHGTRVVPLCKQIYEARK